jgi:starch synthase
MSMNSKASDIGTATRRVLFVTPEIADFVQTGGLGEVSAALPRALRAFSDTRVLIPGYRQALEGRGPVEIVARLPGAAELPPCSIGRLRTRDGLIVYVVIAPELYDRPGGPYVDPLGRDWPDNDVRFARLALAAAEFALGAGDPNWRPDNLHLNDWPTALASGYVAWRGGETATILTIHNLAYQGVFDSSRRAALAIPEAAFAIDGVEFHGKLSFLKAGVFYADYLTTVSETYAREITTPELGCGLHGLLEARAREGRLAGILNGIDDSWGPLSRGCAGDGDGAETEKWKAAHAEDVRRSFGLALSRGPLFAIVSRLVHQKGVDLAIEAAEDIVAHGGQLVITGNGDRDFETRLLDLAGRHENEVGVKIGFDAAEARRMFAASDFLLMPSRFEPCGLSQMYAQKSGSLPIATKTGGLADTIEDGRTGFLFAEPTPGGLRKAIGRALSAFAGGETLTRMRRAAMAMRFDWERSARRYVMAYARRAG